jgi:Cu+-exporting ATPase
MNSENICIHCGADCGKTPILLDENKFCCNGCKQVYLLLNENRLHQYYTLAKIPGIKTEELSYKGKYAYLDKDEVKNKLYEYYENNLAKVTFYIPVIHCISCIWLLENLNKLNQGIKQSSVNFVKKTCSITFSTEDISLRQIVELLVSIHYVPDISLQMFEGKVHKISSKALTYKIGVAGFIAGNVMLFSLPLYFNGKPLDGTLGVFFSYISFILTIPIVFYCSSDYLISAWKAIIKKNVNIDFPIALGIITLFSVTSYEVISMTGQGYSDSLSGLLFFLLLGKWYQSKTYEALTFDRDYKSYFPIAVTRIINEEEENVLLKDIQVNDLLLIRNKELIPADSLLVEGIGLIDYSFVSGESVPIRKEIGEPLYAGGIQTQGVIKIKIVREVSQSHLTQLWNESEMKQQSSKHLLPIIDRISLWFTLIIVTIAFAGFFYWWLLLGQFHIAVLVFSSVLIVTCPCALALSLPFSLGNSMRLLGLQGVYLKNTQVVENLCNIDTIVFDKTGTITVPDQNNITYNGKKLDEFEIIAVASLARQSTHPLSQSLSKYFENIETAVAQGFVEISGKGTFAIVNGYRVRIGSAEYLGIENNRNGNSSARVYVELDNIYCGYFMIGNKYRDGFLEVAKTLSCNFKLYLLSGDNQSEKEVLKSYFDEDSMNFEQSPQDKMNFVKQLQIKGHNVLMAGDGLNDAGAFMQSNVAMSVADDIYHFSPAGDVIIEAGKFYLINNVIRFSKQSLIIVKISIAISFIYNVFGLVYALSGNMSPVFAAILMPISSVSVVAFAIFGTKLLANRTINKK